MGEADGSMQEPNGDKVDGASACRTHLEVRGHNFTRQVYRRAQEPGVCICTRKKSHLSRQAVPGLGLSIQRPLFHLVLGFAGEETEWKKFSSFPREFDFKLIVSDF